MWDRSGATILEGYGATECSPVIAVSLPDRNRRGSSGPLLPLIEARLDPVEGIHEGGRLVVRGPNVMKGYLAPDGSGRITPPEDGWYDTGDIVTLEDGLVTIRGRAKRFAKVGGEMISLAAVESMAQSLWPDAKHVVVALPDPRKGEQVVLITDKPDAHREPLLAHARGQGYPELWVPKAILISGVPVLGSGKVDYAGATEMARRLQSML
jgi:acyl-[acyl-carrier-protein]-phospholipid O-acyltransferase/long-chain-fatty-acid--[acyl-carrier-protein] ligase